MKKLCAVLVVMSLFVNLGYSDAKALMPDREIVHYEASSFSQLQEWMVSVEEDAFSEVKNRWKEVKSFVFPEIAEISPSSILVSSNVNTLTFHYDTAQLNIAVTPVEKVGDVLYDDIFAYTEAGGEIKYNEKLPIVYDEPTVSTGYEYSEQMYVKEKVKFGDKTRDCLLNTKYSEKGNTQYSLSFIEHSMRVNVIWYESDGQVIDKDFYRNILFVNYVGNISCMVRFFEMPMDDTPIVMLFDKCVEGVEIAYTLGDTDANDEPIKPEDFIMIPKKGATLKVYEKTGPAYSLIAERKYTTATKKKTLKVNVSKIKKGVKKIKGTVKLPSDYYYNLPKTTVTVTVKEPSRKTKKYTAKVKKNSWTVNLKRKLTKKTKVSIKYKSAKKVTVYTMVNKGDETVITKTVSSFKNKTYKV